MKSLLVCIWKRKIADGKRSKIGDVKRGLLQVFAKHGVYKIVPKVGELLDTSQHEAVFDVPDPSKEPGTIAVVMKVCPFPSPASPVCRLLHPVPWLYICAPSISIFL